MIPKSFAPTMCQLPDNRSRRLRDSRVARTAPSPTLLAVFSPSHPCGDISAINIYSKLHGTVNVCLLSPFALRSHFLFRAKSFTGYMHASVFLPLSLFLCCYSRDSRISLCWKRLDPMPNGIGCGNNDPLLGAKPPEATKPHAL